jgi:Ca-activated chloride channel homolog
VNIPSMTLLALVSCASIAPIAEGAGTLRPKTSPHAPIAIHDHHVDVLIRDGFARTLVRQTFVNPNPAPLEAIYSFPLPKGAALADVIVTTGDEMTLRGEVVAREDARKAYEEERDQGNDAALAEKNDYRTFEFAIANVKPNQPTIIEFTYYQTLLIDTGIGRYLYPLEEGGTDETRAPFWETNAQVDNGLSIAVEVRSTFPIEKLYAPGFESATITNPAAGRHRFEWNAGPSRLDRDFVFYYALEDALPGRVELVPYRANESAPGTFMLVVTPGVDLKPLTTGYDTTIVLDVSGSMASKIGVLADGVAKSLTSLRALDRFRIITFSESARLVSGGFLPATPESVSAAVATVKGLKSGGSTNLEAGIKLALRDLDVDRPQSIVLVTDGVANVGAVNPASFVKLLDKIDVRVFGFLLGNESNWPLVEAITSASGGFYECVSNQDDIVSRLALVKPKLTHEAMHGIELEIDGDADPFDVDDSWVGNRYAGQQLVVFGRYRNAGNVDVTLRCKISGEEKKYSTRVALPAIETTTPELERMFALHRIESIQRDVDRGLADANEAKTAKRDLGLQYQIVTDETSMLVLHDDAFTRRGIDRHNLARTEAERKAAATNASAPVVDRRADPQQPMFEAPSFSRKSGAIDGIFLAAAGLILVFVVFSSRRSVA